MTKEIIEWSVCTDFLFFGQSKVIPSVTESTVINVNAQLALSIILYSLLTHLLPSFTVTRRGMSG